MEQNGHASRHRFLEEGGEMGGLIERFNWSGSELGPIDAWPQSLRLTLGILLHSRFPMFLFWGPGLICFYNDAYRPSLGQEGKHPEALGRPGREVWPEIWDRISPMIDQVLSGGEAIWNENQLLPIFRNNQIEDVYWTYSYSPVYDEHERVNGVFVTCQETTGTVVNSLRLEEEQRRFASLMQQAPAGIAILKGYDFVAEMANDYYLRLLGKGQEFIGRPIWESIPEVRDQGFDQLMRQVLDTGIPYRTSGQRVEIMREQLDTIYVDFVYEPLKDLDGSINRIMVVVIDVTAQILARQRVEDAEERARLAVEATQLGTFDYNMSTEDLITSPRFDTIFGLDGGRLHRNYVERIHPDDAHLRIKAHEEALVTGILFYETRITWSDGSEHWVRVKGKVYHDEEGLPRRLLGTALDITEERQAREALARAAEKLEGEVRERTRELAESNQQLIRINAELEQFAYVASHDLQEPLRKVRTFTQMLDDHLAEGDDRTKGLLAKIGASSARMLTLIRDLLNFSQLSASQEEYVPVDLNELLAQIREDFELLVEQKGAQIEADGLPVIEGIPTQLNQLFTNLVSNSLKFSKEGRPPRITIVAEKPDQKEVEDNPELNPQLHYYCIRFSDNGIGFSQEHAQQIFTIFQRLHDRQSYSGTGIGLALCKKIAVNHQGDIYARSAPGEGATFYLWLPATQA